MPSAWLVICSLVLPQAFAFDDLSRIESRLPRLLADPGYQDAFYRLVEEAFLNLPRPTSAEEAYASARVQASLVSYADRNLRLQFVRDSGTLPGAITAQVYGNRIVVNTVWLERATEDDLHASLAHEVAHDANDCIRFWLITESNLTKRQKENAKNQIEMKADARAIELLQREKRDPRILANLLIFYLPPGQASIARIAAVQKHVAVLDRR